MVVPPSPVRGVAERADGLGARGATAPARHPPTAPDRLARFYDQRIDWHTCALGPDDEPGQALDAAGADCADITVPLDYTDPGGRTITVAVSRLKATDTDHRVGPLLLNDGGPAGPGLHMPLTKSQVMGEVADRYDLIGMDPRFVGRSTPLDCGWDLGSAFLRSAGADPAAYREEVAVARELAGRCERAHGDVLPYVTTRNTARDMDVIRAALGADTLSYLGYSYGSYLGEVYSQLFPGRWAAAPRTLYAGAEAIREQWQSSRLLTVKGARQHGLYGEYGNACVDERVNAYLRTGRLPAHDPTCGA
ncbi:alpha/beta fold hydrolase [Streptomyces sp. NPDC053720]|uniref:alpha/beta fold hydrolase n=1 Tax=Streptomyces sp. NPDC053720 TaxID=3154855 RepID=UPI0034175285